ncbi:BQ2448_1562 [Microbotryum intermedium]|uniref:BQ2448_1562 protein n=1 Tax=Microbotryum intermedium TaxID=269621 RepID=A0A238FG90_9BASI|nr:BQ2448_1562 [Microbotryum intermedium]
MARDAHPQPTDVASLVSDTISPIVESGSDSWQARYDRDSPRYADPDELEELHDSQCPPPLTPLDQTLEIIGFGSYQKVLLVLCGFGWMADNMWLQCVAIILPRVQEHFDIGDQWIGLLSTSIFAGMMLGAAAWGSCEFPSQIQTRKEEDRLSTSIPLTLVLVSSQTLLLTSAFGLAAALAPSFLWLCFALFWLGTSVGGSMPTDGTLFLENSPPSHHYLLTALSFFFSLGAVLTSLLGVTILPSFSCAESPPAKQRCDVSRDNNGWRIMLGCLALVSLFMGLARIGLFRLRESAKFLVSSGHPDQAVLVLERISRYNGEPTSWELKDVVDGAPPVPGSPLAMMAPTRITTDYDTMGDLPASLDGSRNSIEDPTSEGHPEVPATDRDGGRRPRTHVRSRDRCWWGFLERRYAEAFDEHRSRVDDLFSPPLRFTTSCIWCIWFLASAGYTIFNVFLPKYLEQKLGESTGEASRTQSLWDYVLYTVSGLPGAPLGAWLIESRLGRVKTLAFSTLATSAGTLIFVLVSSQAGVVSSSMFVSLVATLMYAVIYGYTPEAFPVASRGTACGIASALSRLAGIFAPIITGFLLSISVSLPLFLSALCFLFAALAAWSLPRSEKW